VRFLPLPIKRLIWGLVGDCVNAMVMLDDLLMSEQQKNKSK